MRKIGLFLLFIIILISCKKTMDPIYLNKDLRDARLTGRVISEEGLPLDKVRVRLTISRETKTDVNGNFLFRFLSYGKYNMTFHKEEYLSAEYQLDYNFKNRKSPFVKVKMYSKNYLVKEGFEYLKEKNYEKTKEMIDKLEQIDPKEDVVMYLNAMYYYVKENYPESLMILEKLKERDRSNVYYQLTLVDIYEKLELFKKQANLSFYIASTNPKEYYKYYKIAADIYKEKLNNNVEYEKSIRLYNDYSKKYGDN